MVIILARVLHLWTVSLFGVKRYHICSLFLLAWPVHVMYANESWKDSKKNWILPACLYSRLNPRIVPRLEAQPGQRS
jgi:hypothetical protein